MARFALHAIAPDRPGIVAAVADALAALGCNLEESRMWRLRGQFAIVLLLEAPGIANGTAIEEVLAPLLETFALQLFVRPIPPGGTDGVAGDLVEIRVDGLDHPGTVARVAHAVAGVDGDIVHLVGHVAPEDPKTPSRLELTAALPPGRVDALRSALGALAGDLDMRWTLTEAADEVSWLA